ncbi:MAG: aminotransferase class III-fold pyridoxal phosphate-dependent enzyme [Gemmatimonadota bacterium]
MASGIPDDAVLAAVAQRYALRGEWRPLVGYDGRNYVVRRRDGVAAVVKVASPQTPTGQIDLEAALYEHLAGADIGVAFPRLIPTQDGRDRVSLEDGRTVRLLSFLQGALWADRSTPASPAQLLGLGETLGRLTVALEPFSHPGAERHHEWRVSDAPRHGDAVGLVPAPRRALVERALLDCRAAMLRFGSELRRAVIHGDANDHNLFVDGDRLVGLCDLGDASVDFVVAEPAIAIAYAVVGTDDPLEAAGSVAAGFHRHAPLAGAEFAALWPFVRARLAVTVLVAARRRQERPDEPYLYVSEAGAWSALEATADVPPSSAEDHLRRACGLSAVHDRAADVETLREARRAVIGPSLSVSYRRPLAVIAGRGQYLFDADGRAYLDLVNNVCHVGHCHPRVVAAGQAQMATLNTNTRYLYPQLTEYAERLCGTLPDPLSVAYFVCSGTEANELALRLARAHTGRPGLLVLDGAYHGHTGTLIGASPYKFRGPGGSGAAGPGVATVPTPDPYRGPLRGDGEDVGIRYGDAVAAAIGDSPRPVGAFLAESLPGCAGQIVPPPGYLRTAFAHVRGAGGVCIIDEVQVGFGRVGEAFWGFELQGVVPDIVVLGKPMGNGHPMGAVVTTREIADSFDNGMEFFSTFGGNPVSCAIGTAVLDVIRDERLQERAVELGSRFVDGLRGLSDRFACIGDVRGAGLFMGLEIIKAGSDVGADAPPAPDATVADAIVQRMRELGVLLSADGPDHNVIKIKPPMVLDADDVDTALRLLETTLDEVAP